MSANCLECGLYHYSPNPRIPGKGNLINPKVVLIGEAPGPEERLQGEVFIGRAGRKLDEMLGEDKDAVFITNCVKCYPPIDPIIPESGFRAPTPKEIEYCKEFLLKDLSKFQDDVILMPMGNPALTALVGDHNGITKEIGILREVQIGDKTFRLIPNFHPAYVLRNNTKKPKWISTFQKALNGGMSVRENIEHHKILNPAEALDSISDIMVSFHKDEFPHLYFDIETSDLFPWHGEVIMLQYGTDMNENCYSIPIKVSNIMHHTTGYQFQEDFYKIPWEVSKNEIAQIQGMTNEMLNTIPLIGHSIKFDIKWCAVHDFLNINHARVADDTLALAVLAFGRDRSFSLSLKNLCQVIFSLDEGWEDPINTYLALFSRVKDRHFGNIPTSILAKYGNYDIEFTRKLYKWLTKELKDKPIELLRNQLNRLTEIFAKAETHGSFIDNEMYSFISERCNNYVDRMNIRIRGVAEVKQYISDRTEVINEESLKRRTPYTPEKIQELSFSPTSSLDLTSILYNEKYLNLPIKVRTAKKKPSLAKDTLKMIMKDNRGTNAEELMDYLIILKTFNKLKSTYIDSLPSISNQGSHKPEFNLFGTVTGRLSSGWHTIPSKSDIKRMYVSRWRNKGGLIGSPDFSQLELRVIASVSNETSWIEAYKRGIDIHDNTARTIFDIKKTVSKSQRKSAKIINFGIIFGKVAFSLADDLGISVEEAQDMIDTLFKGANNLKKFIENQHQIARKDGKIVTPFGRIIPISESLDRSKQKRSEGDRRAVNNMVQSPASDLVNASVVETERLFKERKLKTFILGVVHDAVVPDIYPGELFDVINIQKYAGEDYLNETFGSWLKAPIIFDMEWGASWGGSIGWNLLELTDDKIVAEGTALRKDFKLLEAYGGLAYNIKTKVLEVEKLKDEDFDIDVFFRDQEKWKAEVTFSRK